MTQALEYLLALPGMHDRGLRIGLTSVCSAHPLVIEAALIEAAADNGVALIEATCNQVNQDGGYTGMTPVMYVEFVLNIAKRIGFSPDRILFGGDHLGPNPWKNLAATEAMQKAQTMTSAYARAGFSKIHLDASMSCADDPNPLPTDVIAERAALLAQAAETGARAGGHPPPAYIIGTEVPVPGGAAEALETLQPTETASADHTVSLHQRAFCEAGLDDVFARCIGLVVQPGVEFGHANIIHLDPVGTSDLTGWRNARGDIVYEAHSTDYQTARALSQLVKSGFAILKVGPGLTFAMREAFYALDQIAGNICEDYKSGSLPAEMEKLMLARPEHWENYYSGSDQEQRIQRHFSYSDRIRYYWATPEADAAVDDLLGRLEKVDIPDPLVSQFLPLLYRLGAEGHAKTNARDLLIAAIRLALAPYSAACRAGA